jgi:hypothetical protein
LALPHLEIEGGKLVEQQVTWPAGPLTARKLSGLKEAKAGVAGSRNGLLAALFPRQPANVWTVDQPQWHCVLAATNPEGAQPATILFAEQQALPAGDGRWLHQADWLVQARDLRELRVALPDGGVPLRASIDGAVVAHLLSPATVGVPLPPRPGIYHVRLCWRYSGDETWHRPRLSVPRLADVSAGPTHGMLALPDRTRVRGGGELASERETARLAALARASIAAAIAASKQEAGAHGLSAPAWQYVFLEATRHMEYQAQLGRDAEALAAVNQMRKEYLATVQQRGWEAIKGSDAGDSAWSTGGLEAGRPLFWHDAPPQQTLEEMPSDSSIPWRVRDIVVLVVVGVFLLSWLPYGVALLVRLWPEQIAALALLGWALWGESLVAWLLVGTGLMCRLLTLLTRLVRLVIAQRAGVVREPSSSARRHGSA